MSAPAPVSTYTKDNPFQARLVENRLLNKPGSGKETRHFVISLAGSDLTYKAGDSLGVYPTNRPEDVDGIIQALGATGGELVSPAMLRLPAPLTLREVLASRVSLAGPTAKIIQTLASKATEPTEQATLAGLLAPESKDVLTAFLAEREYIDLLMEFPSARLRLTPQEFVDHLRKLMPRLYSIASSARPHPTDVHLTVAVVRYESNHRPRVGVCSTFLADRAKLGETPVPVFVSNSHFGPPQDPSRDAIMVGPGTGIAPFRAFVQDRVAIGATGRNWVFFGDQHATTDFLYEDEWTQYLAKGQITKLDLAWSRDQLTKVYVQDKMRASAAELWDWIKNGGHFYVCGDARRMAKDVDTALHDIIAEQGGMSIEQAGDYVKQMKKDKRYQRDVY
ncbi:sulfite reductase subunit alpha [Opitutaceae bacterium TAV4]|nr:sulfite reductase subunit alpha [Opitutaceae bacterium TAV4]RRJ99161.1 sulfite reductase subunit alpha [Opitutaceae bacterium TAV3]